jgi:hypothetical protein
MWFLNAYCNSFGAAHSPAPAGGFLKEAFLKIDKIFLVLRKLWTFLIS